MTKNLMSIDTASLEIHALVYKLVSVGFLYPDDVWQKRMLGLVEEFYKSSPYNFESNISKIRRYLSPSGFRNFNIERDCFANARNDTPLGHCEESRRNVGTTWQSNLTKLQEEHFMLFGPDPVCHLEIAHWTQGDVFMQSRKMAEMAGFYRAFGLDMNDGLRVDNLSIALEFLSYLCIKILHAAKNGYDDNIDITEKAFNSFRDEFVLPGLDRFVESIKTNSKTGFYEVIGELAKK